MTTAVLALITLIAAVTLVGVLWSLVRALRAERSNARLRRDGVQVTGTIIDNSTAATTQRRLLFSPVVEFQSLSGHLVAAPAQQQAASSWARGTTVEVRYDPVDPHRFVLAGPPGRGHLVANLVVALIIVAVMTGAVVAMYHVWDEFRYDRAGRDVPGRTSQGAAPSGRG